jgi:hypothetical protein
VFGAVPVHDPTFGLLEKRDQGLVVFHF